MPHPEKTKIVYCQDSDRRGSYDHIQFDFLPAAELNQPAMGGVHDKSEAVRDFQTARLGRGRASDTLVKRGSDILSKTPVFRRVISAS